MDQEATIVTGLYAQAHGGDTKGKLIMRGLSTRGIVFSLVIEMTPPSIRRSSDRHSSCFLHEHSISSTHSLVLRIGIQIGIVRGVRIRIRVVVSGIDVSP